MPKPKNKSRLSHLSATGAAQMVDVSSKPVTRRVATAEGRLRVSAAAIDQIEANTGPKGSVLSVATVAAISGAKRTSDLVPLCHNLTLDKVVVDFNINALESEVVCTATVSTESRTGVEMEALTAVHVGLLTVYDMCKAVDRDMEVVSIRLVDKQGGTRSNS